MIDGGFAIKRDLYFRNQFRHVLETGEKPELGVDMWATLAKVACPVLVMRGMGLNRQHVLSVQIFPYGENRKLILTQDITELERTDSMRRDFVANVSHELKTPLTVLASVADTAVVPMQDILGLGSSARMNLPGSTRGHWRWRMRPDAITSSRSDRLCRLNQLYER